MGDTNYTPITFVDGPPPLTAAQLNSQVRDPFTQILGAHVGYTPVWTATGTAPVIGNGSLTGRYNRVGKTMDVFIQLTAGSSTTFGTGAWAFTLPTAGLFVGPILFGDAFDSSAATHSLVYGVINGGSLAMSGGTTVTNVLPIPWAQLDTLTITGRYEAS